MSHTVASYIDRLPQEVWAIVIEHLAGRRKHGDQMYLWNICRLVSRQFKYAVEAFFLHRFLHKTLIRMEAIICTEYTSHWDFRVAKCFETRFDQMSIDGNRAIFKVKNEGTITSFKGLLSDKTRRDWQYCFIQLCTHTNYANIRLHLNPEEAIELDWRELFGANLATRRLCTRPGCGWVGPSIVILSLGSMHADHSDAREQVRCERLVCVQRPANQG